MVVIFFLRSHFVCIPADLYASGMIWILALSICMLPKILLELKYVAQKKANEYIDCW